MNEIPGFLFDYMEGLKTHDVDRIAATVADDMVAITPAATLNKEQFLQMLRALYAGFPDWHYAHDEPEIRGPVIAVKWRQGGTHTATYVLGGLAPIPATGKRVSIPEQHFFYRIRGDRIVEIRPEPVPGGAPWGIWEQLGAKLPPA
jgi:predicted ester cyclase